MDERLTDNMITEYKLCTCTYLYINPQPTTWAFNGLMTYSIPLCKVLLDHCQTLFHEIRCHSLSLHLSLFLSCISLVCTILTGKLLTSSYLSASLLASCLPVTMSPFSSRVVEPLWLSSSFSCLTSLQIFSSSLSIFSLDVLVLM